MVVTLWTDDAPDGRSQELLMHRVPPFPGYEHSYAGAFRGAILSLDTRRAEDDGPDDVDALIGLTLAFEEESATEALSGLGFAKAFSEAFNTRFDCPDLLPSDGLTAEGRQPIGEAEREIWDVAAFIGGALAQLERHDGQRRDLPPSATPQDLARAQMILQLFRDGEIRLDVPADEEFEVGLPAEATTADDPAHWMTFEAPLPDLAGHPSISLRQVVERASPLAVNQRDSGGMILRCRASSDGAAVTARVVDS